MALLETNALTKAFGALIAVDNVNLTVEEGMIHSIIGPNGAGKTTFFNLLAGVITPTRGNIIFQGSDISSLKVHERCEEGIGRSFQITSIFAALNVRENIRLAAQSKRKEKFSIFRRATDFEDVEERTTAFVDQFGLSAFENQSAETIPYGTQRILEVAIAVATEPVLLLLDEPTSGMSPEDTVKMISLIRTLSGRYTTVLIEHNMNVVMSISDIISVLHQGKIIAEGSPEYVQGHEEVMRAYLGEKVYGKAKRHGDVEAR